MSLPCHHTFRPCCCYPAIPHRCLAIEHHCLAIAHCCSALLAVRPCCPTIVPCYSPFSSTSWPPPPCFSLACYSVSHLVALPCQLVLSSHSLMQMEELGYQQPSFNNKGFLFSNFLSFFFLCFLFCLCVGLKFEPLI